MLDVSGVTGAGPILHEIFEHLHAAHPTTWYDAPPGVVERTVHRVTGHLLTSGSAGGPDAMTEKFLMEHLPPAESPADYDARGRVRLPPEYAAWLSGGDNWLAGRAVAGNEASVAAAGAAPALVPAHNFSVISPMPGTTFVLDPDLPPSSRLLDLRVRGCEEPRWECPTLDCRVVRGRPTAVLQEGRHALRVQDAASGEWRETWIVVKAL